ncbi:MAG: DUF2723 domain-containing protein [Verrucomicrobiae bacterium]|nr:DUF2723 domain-containing protein [Verrucomicrobiae bacterium]
MRAAVGRWGWVWFVVAVALYAPLHTAHVYHWDGAQFVLAVQEFSVRLSQPHAPGYPLYVGLGKVAAWLTGDAHRGLLWLSTLSAAGLVVLSYRLAAAWWGARAGLAAGLWALTSPQVWFHGAVALTYAVDALAVTALVAVSYRAIVRGGRWSDVVLIGVMMAVVGGVRPQSVLPLSLTMAWVFSRFQPPRIAKLVTAAGIAAVLALVWLVPTVASAGGWDAFRDIVRRHAAHNAPVTWVGGGLPALVDNVVAVGAYCWVGLLGAVVPLAVGLVSKNAGPAKSLVAAWVLPMLLAGTVVGFTSQPGYVLSYLPGLLLLAAAGARGVPVIMVGFVAALNVAVFWAPTSWTDRVRFGVPRVAEELRRHDAQLAQTLSALRREFSPADTVLLHAGEWFTFGTRHFQVHAPEFDQYQLIPDPTVPCPPGKAVWRIRQGRLGFAEAVEVSGYRHVVLVVPPGMAPSIFGRAQPWAEAQPVAGSGGTLYVLSRRT